jgi:PBSX family phage terminase large subunit
MPATDTHVYEPRGGAKTLFESRAPELLICGPSGTGKSRAALETLNTLAELHPAIRVLIARQTRKSLSESVLVEYERSVLPPGSPLLNSGGDRTHRTRYDYPNGSEIVLGGLDDTARIMSSQYDVLYVPEVTELSEADWEILLSRLRNGQLRDRLTGEPWHQAIADCNPSYPTHWVKRRCDRGQTLYIESRHEDNPACSAEYIERLSQLTGVRRQRLYEGRWVAAEGSVYSEWDATIHMVDPFKIPWSWPRIRSIDFGFTNPMCVLWITVDPADRLFVYRQLYMSHRLVEDVAADILQLSRGETIAATICDHDAEGRATLERRHIRTIAAHKNIIGGVQAVQARLRKSSDGRPRLYVVRDSLVERDAVLLASKAPLCLEDEFQCYTWEQPRDGAMLRETPIDKDNHALDSLRYAVVWLDRRMAQPKYEPQAVIISTGVP